MSHEAILVGRGMELETHIRELAPKLLRYCIAQCADAPEGEELAQSVLTALVQRWRRSGPPDDVAAFAFAIARRRAQRRRWWMRLRAPLDALSGDRASGPDPEQITSSREALGEALRVLDGLSTRDREALLLVASGLSTEEAARSLSITPSAFKMRVHRARQRLQDRLTRAHTPRSPA